MLLLELFIWLNESSNEKEVDSFELSSRDFLASFVVGWFEEESLKLNDWDEVDKEGDAGCETDVVGLLLIFWLFELLLKGRFLVDFESSITTKQSLP
jgi:hypothetical protein